MHATRKQIEKWLAEQREFTRVGVITPVHAGKRRVKIVKRKASIDGQFIREFDEVIDY